MTSTLGFGVGLNSLYSWLSASAYLPGLLRLDVRFEHSSSFGNDVRRCFEVSYLIPPNLGLLLDQVLPPMNSDWRLTLWSVSQAHSKSWATFGTVGGEDGEESGTRSTTDSGLICS